MTVTTASGNKTALWIRPVTKRLPCDARSAKITDYQSLWGGCRWWCNADQNQSKWRATTIIDSHQQDWTSPGRTRKSARITLKTQYFWRKSGVETSWEISGQRPERASIRAARRRILLEARWQTRVVQQSGFSIEISWIKGHGYVAPSSVQNGTSKLAIFW